MPPILHLMRHGQGFHSEKVTKNGHLIRDPELTDEGKEQCRRRCEAFTRHEQVDLLLASPLRRAIQTCQLAFRPAMAARQLKISLLPLAEEVSDDACDTGSPPAVLRAEFDDGSVDFDALTEAWYEHRGDYATDAKAVMARALKLRLWLRARPEREVCLVSHGFFNHFVTGEVDAEGKQTTGWWEEAEMRTYTFAEGSENEETAALLETAESVEARGGKAV